MCERAQRVDHEWLFSIHWSHVSWCLSLPWYIDVTQNLSWSLAVGFSLFQLLSPWCLMMFLSSLQAGAGWIHKVNIAVIALEFITRYIGSELGYLKKRGVSGQGSGSDNCLQKDLVRLHLFICCKLIVFSFSCCHFPMSPMIHSLLHGGPLGLPEMTLLLDDVAWMTQVFLVIWFH